MESRTAVHLISHTHWDREWYLTQEQYRIRLADLIDHMIELLESEPEFRFFHLDGQTVVIDDYAAVRPSRLPALRRLIAAGRVLVGPWYEQNDLFLTSAESTVRNLMEGIRAARELGTEMRVGYLPDHFGLIGQMPQIFRLVGIDNAIFGRGFDVRRHGTPRFRWSAPDGSSIVAIHMTFWYNNAQRFAEDDAAAAALFTRIVEREQTVAADGPYLLMNGVDHLEAQENLVPILSGLRRKFDDDYEILHSTLPAYVQALRDEHPEASLPEVVGELREGESYRILNGTLSARVYLKQANDRCGDLIEKWVEPLSVWCAAEGLEAVDREYMRFLWKLFMENHPHDSICGCSQDAVHEHMLDRYERVTEIAEALIDRKASLIVCRIDETGSDPGDLKLVVMNMSGIDAGGGTDALSACLTVPVYFLSEDDVRDFDLLDPDGRPVPYRVVTQQECRTLVLSPINLPGVLSVRRVDIEFIPSVPAYGYTCYRAVRNVSGTRLTDQPRASGAPVLENDHLRVTVRENGTFNVEEKASGRTFVGAGRFLDVTDGGDLYVSAPVGEEVAWDGPVEFLWSRTGELSQECSWRFVLDLPADLERAGQPVPDATEPDSTATAPCAATAPCEVTVTLRLDAGSRLLDVIVDVDNAAKDHRLRVALPIADATGILAGGQFEVCRRAFDEGRAWERSANGQPFWKWVAADRDASGLAVYAEGLHEYELIDGDTGLAVTLLRCVETINVRLQAPLETDIQPLAQCPGRHSFRFAIRPYDGASPTRLAQEADRFHMGLRHKQGPVNDARWFQGRSWVQDSAAAGAYRRPDPNAGRPAWPRSGRLLQIDGPLLVSAVKWHETQEKIVVRVVNLDSREHTASLSLCRPVVSAFSANLLEERIADAPCRDAVVTVRAGGGQIVTVAAELSAP